MTVKEEMKLKTDIQIAQEAQMLPIREVAERAGIAEEDLEKQFTILGFGFVE